MKIKTITEENGLVRYTTNSHGDFVYKKDKFSSLAHAEAEIEKSIALREHKTLKTKEKLNNIKKELKK